MDEQLMNILFWFSVAVMIICAYTLNLVVLSLWRLHRNDSEWPIAPTVRAFAVLGMIIPGGMVIFGLFTLLILLVAAGWDFIAKLVIEGQI